MLETVRATIRRQGLFAEREPLVAAVSGGIDSMALLHLLLELGASVTVAHVDHMLRGDESAEDASFVEASCRRLGVPLFRKSFDVAAHAAARRLSVQEAAREIRYQYLEEVARETGGRKVVTAHHADDQAETVLMRLLRGTGLKGLGGIPYRRPLSEEGGIEVVRPLLDVRREEIERYAAQTGIAHREDRSNASTKYLRNKIRIQLLPLLEGEYEADVRGKLLRLAETAREDEKLLHDMAVEAMARVAAAVNEAQMRVDVKELAILPVPLQRRVITLILYYLRGHTKQWEQVHIDSLRALALHSNPSAAQSLPHGLAAWREYDRLCIGAAESGPGTGHDTGLEEDSVQPLSERDVWYVSGEQGMHTLDKSGIRLAWHTIDGVLPRPSGAWEIHLDADEVSTSRIYIRTWAIGDRFRPLGLPGTKLVSDVFIDAKVPKRKRFDWPLLCLGNEVAWVIGIRRGRQALVTGHTRRTLVIRATLLGGTSIHA